MISRMEVTSPPGVSIRRMTTSACRATATARPSFSCLTLAGPMAPSISTVNATFGRPLASPIEEEGVRAAAATRAAARRATRASFTLKAPHTRYGFDFAEIHAASRLAAQWRLAISPFAGLCGGDARQGGGGDGGISGPLTFPGLGSSPPTKNERGG